MLTLLLALPCPAPPASQTTSCIAFAANLQRHHKLPLSKAYAVATAQFAHLRAVQEVATRAAFREARAYGADADSLASGELVRLTPASRLCLVLARAGLLPVGRATRRAELTSLSCPPSLSLVAQARHNKKTENQLAKWQPSGLGAAKAGNAASSSGKRGGRTPQATGVWQLDASPSYRALEGSFSGGQAWVEGWGKWKAWAGERRQAKAEHLDRERRRAK